MQQTRQSKHTTRATRSAPGIGALLIGVLALYAAPSAARDDHSACVPDSILERTEYYYEANRHKAGKGENWFRVLIAFGARTPEQWTADARRLSPFPASTARANVDKWHGWNPIATALECIEYTDAYNERNPPAPGGYPDGIDPFTVPVDTSLPATPAPTKTTGWFGWDLPKVPVDFPESCKDVVVDARAHIRDNAWSDAALLKYNMSLRTNNRAGWWAHTHRLPYNSCGSVAPGTGYRGSTLSYGQTGCPPEVVQTTLYSATTLVRGPNGEAPGAWRWSVPPKKFFRREYGAPADGGSVKAWIQPDVIMVGHLQCGVASEATGGANTPVASMRFVRGGGSTLATNEAQTDSGAHLEAVRTDVAIDFDAKGGGPREYTVVFNGGSAERGYRGGGLPSSGHGAPRDYTIWIKGRFRFYDNEPFSQKPWTELEPRHSRVRFELRDGANAAQIRIYPQFDTRHGEGPETAVIAFEKPSPMKYTISGNNNRAVNRVDDWRLGTVRTHGSRGIQGWSDPDQRAVTLTINDRAGATTLAKTVPAITVHGLTLAEGTKAPGIRAPGCARWGLTDHQWCGGYHRILSWTLPSDMCAHGNIEQTGGAARAGVDFNSSLIGNVSYTFGSARRSYDRHKLCATGSKRVYISTYTDSHDEGEESAELTFVVSEVLESGKRSKTVRPSDVAVTPGTLVITNDGPLPGGYLAELGHTVAELLTRTIAERAAARREPGTSATLGAAPAPGETIGLAETLFGAEGSAASDDGAVAAWARVTRSELSAPHLDGHVEHVTAGADVKHGDWLFGLALERAWSEADYAGVSMDYELGGGLTAAAPYVAWDSNENLILWGSLGAGTGDVKVDPRTQAPMKADTAWRYAAGGARSVLVTGRDFAISSVGSAFWQKITSERTREMNASRSESWQANAGLEASVRAGRLTLTPQVGLSRTGGDVEAETALDIGARGELSAGPVELDVEWGRTIDNDADRLSARIAYDSAYGTPYTAFTGDATTVGWRWEPRARLSMSVEAQGAGDVRAQAALRF